MITMLILKFLFIVITLAIATPWVLFVTTMLGSTQFPTKEEENKTWFFIWVGLVLIYVVYPILIFLI